MVLKSRDWDGSILRDTACAASITPIKDGGVVTHISNNSWAEIPPIAAEIPPIAARSRPSQVIRVGYRGTWLSGPSEEAIRQQLR